MKDAGQVRGERWLAAVVRVLAPADRAEEIAGDLLEEAARRVRPRHGRALAAGWLVVQVVASAPHLVGMRLRRLWPERRAVALLAGDDSAVTRAEAHAAFATFLAEAKKRRELPRVPLALALGAHVVLFAVAAFSSLWTTPEELAPPAVVVSIWAPAPPPRMQDDAVTNTHSRSSSNAGKSAGHRPPPGKQASPSVTSAGVAATEAPASGAPSAVDEQGTGEPGPSGTGSEGDGPPQTLPPQVVARACLACEPPALPPAWAHAGIDQHVLARVCVGADGLVRDVRVLQGISPAADDAVAGKLRAWRYQPYLVQGRPVPFCYTTRIVFHAP
jgi:hypothetical protein